MSLLKALAITVILTCLSASALANDKITLKVLSLKRFGDSERIEIRISERLSQKALERAAWSIKKNKDIDRVNFIFYLPHQKVGASAWATIFYEPNPTVKILGATVEDVQKFRQFSILKNGWRTPKKIDLNKSDLQNVLADGPNTLERGGTLLGEWISDQHGVACKISLFTKDGKTYINSYFADGSQGTVRYKATKVKQGTRLDEMYRKDNFSGDYYLVNHKGQLESHDKDGLFQTLPPERKASYM